MTALDVHALGARREPSDRTRADALARVIACRLYALTEQQLEALDDETTRMVIEAVEGPDAGESKWRPEDQA